MRIRLLGGFSVSVGSRTLEESAWRLRKAAGIVKLLALSPGHRLHREQVMDLLWPDLGKHAASNNLRNALHAVRRIFSPDPGAGHRYLGSEGKSLVLCPESDLWVDVDAFEAAALSAQRSRKPGVYEGAIELYAGELLPADRYEEWTESRRAALRGLYLTLLERLAEICEQREEYGPAVEALATVVTKDPANEEVHTRLMRLYALSEQHQSALAQYERLREVLSRELGKEPGAVARRLREEIEDGRFPSSPPGSSTPRAGPQEGPSDIRKHNLPAHRTSFIGRERELTEVRRGLAMTQLLTLTGPGGCGKTRLALEVARDLAAIYLDGIWLVELAPLTEPELVLQEVARALGVREQPGRSLVGALEDALRNKEILLVLDNCEHLVDACAHLVDALLTSCPRLRILATGREPLGVGGEVIWRVSSLSTPESDRLPAVGELTHYGAVHLFLDRVHLRLPDFDLTPENARAVAKICERLEGMPLAIELATARVGTLTVPQISERLGDSLALLAAGPRTAAPRQRTMRATLEWSFRLLDETEQKLFRSLSVFAGGWTLEAAEALGAIALREAEVLDLFGRLVDKSLVLADEVGGGRVRYRMLEPVRQHAWEKLEESGETRAVRRRHVAWYLALAERAAPELKGSWQVDWLKRLEEENDNLRSTMSWLLEEAEIETAARLACALWLFWWYHGHQGEARRWAEEVLTKGDDLPTGVRANMLWVLAAMSYGVGNPVEFKQLSEEAAVLFREAGDRIGLAHALGGVGVATLQQGDVAGATTILEESLGLFREAADKWGVSTVLSHLGAIPLGQGDHARAARYFEEALELTREVGNMLSGYVSLYNLALAAQGQGDLERAAGLFAEGLSFSVEAGDKAYTAYCLEGLAELAEAGGELERAARLFGAAEALLEDVGGTLYVQAQDRSVRGRSVDALRSRLDEATLAPAWAQGRAMTPEQAARYALSEAEASHPVSEQSEGGTQPIVLTRREQEITMLVVRGMTNRQIASELSISEHTVATHVGKTMRKLGLGSRSRLAAWMAERQGRS